MRQVLPTKPLASASRYGPFFAGHWKYLVESDQGLKQAGFSPGPLTTAGGAAITKLAAPRAAAAAAMRVRISMLVSSFVGRTHPCGRRHGHGCAGRLDGRL